MPGKNIGTLSGQLPWFIVKLCPIIHPSTQSATQAVACFILCLLAGNHQQVYFQGWTPSGEAGISEEESALAEEEVWTSLVGQNG